jgi:exopolysaccharide production protein ExoQ
VTDQPYRPRNIPTPLKSWPVLIFVLGCIGLDLQYFGITSANVGNITLAVGSIFAIVILAISRHNRRSKLKITSIDLLYISYLALLTWSSSWSPSPADTFFQVSLLFTAWIATVFLGNQDITSLVRYIIITAFIVSLLSLAMIPLSSTFAFQPRSSSGLPELRGIFNHQLRLGLYMSMACGLLCIAALNKDLHRIFNRKWMAVASFSIMALVTTLAAARLYTLAVILALVVTFGISRRGWQRYLSLALIAGAVYFILRDQSTLLGGLESQGVDTTLTGRTRLWEKTLRVANQNPGLGYGFPSFDSPNFDWMWSRYRPPHPHNGFIQAYFETGLVGLGLVLVLVAAHFQQAIHYAGRERRYSYTLFIVSLTGLASLVGANYAAKPSSLFAFMMLALAIEVRRGGLLAREARARRRAPPLGPHRVKAGVRRTGSAEASLQGSTERS